jgi:hypothetical protein
MKMYLALQSVSAYAHTLRWVSLKLAATQNSGSKWLLGSALEPWGPAAGAGGWAGLWGRAEVKMSTASP